MGVKNNFSQAVSELIGISRTSEPAPEPEKKDAVEVEQEATEETVEAEEMGQESAEVEESTAKKAAAVQASNPKERIMAMLAQQQQAQASAQPQAAPSVQSQPPAAQVQAQVQNQTQTAPFPPQVPREPKEPAGLTTIARGTVIIGEINAEGDVELLGSVKGKVSSEGDIRVNGKVIGDLVGRDIDLTACAVQGNIIASGMVNVDGDSVVIGDVKGENFCLDGKIKGNVTVEKEAKFQPKAILAGNVTTASIAMSQGAKIQGEVNIPLSEKETNMSFDLDINI